MPAHTSFQGPIGTHYEVPAYRYYPTRLLKNGTRDWSRVRFLQACERLRIPYDLWPQFEPLHIPVNTAAHVHALPFTAPPFDVLQDNATAWREEAEELFRQHCDGFLKAVSDRIQKSVSEGRWTKIEQHRGDIPLALRFEWAAKRYCLKEQYKAMASDQHTAEQIRKVVSKIFADAGLEHRK